MHDNMQEFGLGYHAYICWAIIGALIRVFHQSKMAIQICSLEFTSINYSFNFNAAASFKLAGITGWREMKGALIIRKEWNCCQLDSTACVLDASLKQLQAIQGNGIKVHHSLLDSPINYFFFLCPFCVYIMIWCIYSVRK